MSAHARQFDLKAIIGQFRILGEFLGAGPYGSGHINDTFAARFSQGGTPVRYILQRINHNVFKQPAALMANIERVTQHIAAGLGAQGTADPTRRALTLVPALNGRSFHADADGNHWRVYVFIEKARTYDQIEGPGQAFEAARAFGLFQRQLADLPAPRLVDTIPGFHDTPARFGALTRALEADAHNRAALVKPELEFALARERIAGVLLELCRRGEIPERITHNDTKLNNVMLDDLTGEAVCVIDLDTVMPGLALYDFGDMVRTAARPTAEDERDLAKVAMSMEMFEALVRGYLSSAGGFLNAAERGHLAFSAALITFEIGIRFLTDYLQGDVYFETHRPGHNVDRCRVQFRMAQSFEERHDEMQRLVGQYS